MNINFPDDLISSYSYMAETDNIEEICNMIAAFGTGIADFQIVDVPDEQALSNMPKKGREELVLVLNKDADYMKSSLKVKRISHILRTRKNLFIISIDSDEEVTFKTIKFSHNKNNVLFELSEESDGTYVLDELDRCLHPSLTYKFVETFLKLAERKNIQLIVTTHEARLLDFDLLRRDEVWFVNKRKGGESDIYSLEEYNARFDQKIDKAYLEGRYGGVPIFSTIFPIKEA